jgi:hypothetical protein
VTIHFDATDESEIASVTPDTTLFREGSNQSVTGTAVDVAGNSASFAVKGINIDKSAPNSNAEISGMQGENDWYTSDVSINLTATDIFSGVAQTYYSLDGTEFQMGNTLTVSQEGEHLIKYYSEDKAGNKEAEREMRIKIDKTAPTVKIISPESKTYFNNKVILIKYQKQDNITIAENIKTEIFFDGQMISRDNIDLSLEHLGNHSISISAVDEAGNLSSGTQVNFESKTGANTIFQNVEHYYNLKLITSFRTKYFIQTKLKIIDGLTDLLNVFDHKWMPRWAKERVIENLKRQINHEIDSLENQIEMQRNISTSITPKAKELLEESLEKIKV